jgi:hypothetical protein
MAILTRTTRRVILASALALTCLIVPGCNIVGPIVYLVRGPDKIKKVHALDKTKSTVIFIDDRSNNVPRRSLRIMVGEEAEKTLLKQGTVKDMISTQSAMAAAGTDRFGKPLSNTEIGEAVNAQVLIYATVDSFTLSPDGATLAPSSEMRVRVIDVAADARLWPDDATGYRMFTRLPASAKSMPTSTSARYQVEEDLARLAGLELAQLFYNHEANKGLKVPE